MITPNIGLMYQVSIHKKDEGVVNDKAATKSTISAIHRAMKSQIIFIKHKLKFAYFICKNTYFSIIIAIFAKKLLDY